MDSATDSVESAPPPSLGQVLAAERERQSLSRADVAQRLHMSAYQVEAIETGDYTRLPRGTFLRGFVRNYAKVLGLPADEALRLLVDSGAGVGRPGIVVPTQNIRFDPLADRLSNPYVKAAVIATVALAIGFAGMYWWLFVRTAPPAVARKPAGEVASTPVAPAATPAPVIAASAPAFPAEASRADAAKAETMRAEAMRAEAAKAETAKAEAARAETIRADAAKAEAARLARAAAKAEAPKAERPKVLTDASVLKFRFKGESWVEIRDAKGRILLSRLNAPGSEAEVAGKPPFNVVVGNAPEVQLFYNDQEFDLEPHTRVAVARFTVE